MAFRHKTIMAIVMAAMPWLGIYFFLLTVAVVEAFKFNHLCGNYNRNIYGVCNICILTLNEMQVVVSFTQNLKQTGCDFSG